MKCPRRRRCPPASCLRHHPNCRQHYATRLVLLRAKLGLELPLTNALAKPQSACNNTSFIMQHVVCTTRHIVHSSRYFHGDRPLLAIGQPDIRNTDSDGCIGHIVSKFFNPGTRCSEPGKVSCWHCVRRLRL